MREQGILLRAIEAMDLVDEEDRPRREEAALLRGGDDLP